MIIQQIFVGLLLIAAGVVSLIYNYQLVGITGNVSWVEQYLGGGSTYFFFKMLSVLLCIAGFLYMTGLGTPVLTWLLSPLAHFFPNPRPNNYRVGLLKALSLKQTLGGRTATV